MKYLPTSWENLFQKIKKIVRDYEEENWKWSSINIAVWEPDWTPPETLRQITAEAILKNDTAIHTYWDNRAPENFLELMIQHHAWISLKENDHLSGIALPWEKPMIWLLPIACWANTNKNSKNSWFVKTAPSYDLIGQWWEYLWIEEDVYTWPLYSAEDFKLNLQNLPKMEKAPKMIITVKPWNPCPVWASKENWEELIEYCLKNNVRLVNDWAYAGLVHTKHTPLSQVAKNYPELDWMEFFSVSKTMNACWWRVWTAIGSKDFIEEFSKIKWNADSWAFWPALIWITKYLENPKSKTELQNIQKLYEKRLSLMLPLFEWAWFKKACTTDAWFFVLWKCPKKLNWENIKDSEDFNMKMISTVWVVWVPFSWAEIDWEKEQFIRYTVCAPIENKDFYERVKLALEEIKIEY